MQPNDAAAIKAWEDFYAEPKEDEVDEFALQLAHLARIKKLLTNSLTSANPLQFNTEFVINDSEGSPMTIQQANKDVVWSGALVAATIKVRSIAFKQIESIQVMSPMELVSVQVEVNGKRGTNVPIGSSVGCFGGKKAAAAPAPAPAEAAAPAPAPAEAATEAPMEGDDEPKRTMTGGGRSPKKAKFTLQDSE